MVPKGADGIRQPDVGSLFFKRYNGRGVPRDLGRAGRGYKLDQADEERQGRKGQEKMIYREDIERAAKTVQFEMKMVEQVLKEPDKRAGLKEGEPVPRGLRVYFKK